MSDSLNKKVEKLETKVGDIEKTLKLVLSVMESNSESIDKNFELIIEKFNSIDSKISNIDSKLTKLHGDTDSNFKDVKLELEKINRITGYEGLSKNDDFLSAKA